MTGSRRPSRADRARRSSASRASTRSSPRGDGATTVALQGIDLDIAPRRVRLADRAVGLRQVDAAAGHRRPRPADRAARSRSTASRPRGPASTATTGWSSRRRSCSTGGRSRTTSSCRSRSWAGTRPAGERAGEGDARARRAGRLHAAHPVPAVGRHAAAGRDRPGARVRAGDPAHGRAVRRARRDDPRADERRGAPDLGADRHDGRVRDPLDPRGGLPVVAGRGHERRGRAGSRKIVDVDLPRPRNDDTRETRALLRARHRGPRGAPPPAGRRRDDGGRARRRPSRTMAEGAVG